MTFSLPTFPQPPNVFHSVAGIFLLPQANQKVAAGDCGEAPAGGGDAVPCTAGGLRLQLPASLAPGGLCGGPHCGWSRGKRAPVSNATHVSVSQALEVNFGEDFTVVMQNLPLASFLGPWSFSHSVASAAFIDAVRPSLLEKKIYPADRSFLTCHFGDHQQIL